MNWALLCPGQGHQHETLLDFAHANPIACAIVEEARQELSFDPYEAARDLGMRYDNRVAQPLICIAELAAWACIRDALPPPSVIAGYSVGELASHACAGAMGARTLARLARERAEAMERAMTGRRGGLAFVRGTSRREVERYCLERELWISIVTAEDAFVLGGTDGELAALSNSSLAARAQLGVLEVGIPSHTPLLGAAVLPFASALEASSFAAPGIPTIAGIDGSMPGRRNDAITKLSRQLAQTIEWTRCMDALHERGCRVYLELGPGRALARMLRERFADVEARSLDDFQSLAGAIAWVAKRIA